MQIGEQVVYTQSGGWHGAARSIRWPAEVRAIAKRIKVYIPEQHREVWVTRKSVSSRGASGETPQP